MQTLEGRPLIEYPTIWEYRVIGKDRDLLQARIAQVLKKDFTLQEGRSSSKGKFVSLIAKVRVENQDQRDAIFQALKQSQEVIIVL